MTSPDFLIEAEAIAIGFKGHCIHHPISFVLGRKEIGVLNGANGAGKTSLLFAIVGERPLNAGTVTIANFSGCRSLSRLTRSGIRLIPQFPSMPRSLTVSDVARVWSGTVDYAQSERMLLEEATSLLESSTQTKIGEFSYGRRRLFEMLLAFRSAPRILIADEPFAGLDPEHVEWCCDQFESFCAAGGAALVTGHLGEKERLKSNWTITLKEESA